MARRGSFSRHLPGEVREWVRDGLIGQAQADAILTRYAQDRGRSLQFLQVILIAGAVLLGLGIILIIAHNWNSIHPWVKLGALFALLAGSHYAGWRFRFGTPSLPRVGDAFLLVAGLLFLAGIGLVSQIYHLDERPANGVLLWWVGIAAMPWLAQSSPLQTLSTVGFLAWLGMEVSAGDSWIYLGTVSWTFPAAAVLLGGVLFFVGQWSRVRPLIWSGNVVATLGLVLFAAGSYLLGFVRQARMFPDEHLVKPWLPIILLAALVPLFGGSFRRLGKGTGGRGLLLSFAATTIIAALVTLAPRTYHWIVSRWDLSLAILLWALQIVFALCLVWAGVLIERPGWVNFGAFLFALQVITRYFDLFTTMLDTGLLFILGGVLLLGVGYLTERKRRQLLAAMAGVRGSR
jgi:uncharacterized membrane protein